ncbi:MAG TPA: hypothetical protein PK605_11965 [Ignavibacteria bacterium]|nr:hypothetical protein [Ignavibacteria bacterium]HRE10365.1 hypothetical protein [Ignavibacteria bacterium]HRF65029.1 hypothetical protein [Ignavibacteria bacterium]HRJ05108.1 hypothetical protein [Ignavibacteria bacterium]HRJ84918.1 hypothetical protein [Ignavibacteria bacterium]
MRSLFLTVLLPSFLIILGIILILLNAEFGIFLAAAGVLWLIISFLIDYKEDEEQPLGMGRGRKR